MLGHKAGPGYDLATGLGSPDAYNLIQAWKQYPAVTAAVVPSIDQRPVFQDAASKSWSFVLTLTEEAGIAATVTSLTIDGKAFDVAATFGSASIPAKGSVTSKTIAMTGVAAPKDVVFAISGTDAGGRPWSQNYVVPFQGVQIPIAIAGASNAATGQQTYAPGMLLSIYGTQMGNFAQTAGTLPLPNYMAGFEAWVDGTPAPLYYVSPNQVNIQIPYETSTGNVRVVVGNPYENSTAYIIRVAASAPGIFTTNGFISAPFSSAKVGDITTLFITGEGRVTPSLATGASPSPSTPASRLPAPRLPVTVSVGGVSASTTFIGIPPGLVGVTQINYVVPNVPSGTQPVVVTVGGVASPPANLTIQ
jgi:uncharacterized protein (TIGR03437 family)